MARIKSTDELIAERFGTTIPEEKEEKGEKKHKPERVYYTADFDGLCDLVMEAGKVKFLTMGKEILEKKVIDDKVFNPPNASDLDYLVPTVESVLSEAAKHTDLTDYTDHQQPSPIGCDECLHLFDSLRAYHICISDLPNSLYFDLLALWDFHTYLIEKFKFSPIIYFFADRERGKTRTAKGLIYVARRGVMTETLREANLIRWSRDHKATLLFDVKNFPRKLESAQSEDLVYGRAEKGVVASRVLFPEKGAFQDTIRFEVFGPTVVTSNKMIDDIGMSRTITLEMKPSTKLFTTEPTQENALPLKERLLGMRLAHLNTEFNDSPKQETGRIEDMTIGYLRMIRTLFPSLEPVYKELKKVIKHQKKETALDSFEAQIMQIIINAEPMVESGTAMLPYETICSLYNEGKRENLHIDPRGMGRITKGMGFTAKRNSEGTKRGIFYDTDLIAKLKDIYGLQDDESPGGDGLQWSVKSIKSVETVVDEVFGP
jgi:hypothetical protein